MMVEKTKENVGQYPKEFSADAGYFSETNLKWLKGKIDAYLPGEKIKYNQEPESAPKGIIFCRTRIVYNHRAVILL